MTDAVETIRVLLLSPDAVVWMRLVVFACILGAATAWVRKRPGPSAVLVAIGAVVTGGFWGIQVATPLGLAAAGSASREWAQAGVAAAAPMRGDGFVFGTSLEASLPASLAARGASLDVVFNLPQIAVMTLILVVAILPWFLLSSRTSAAFASAITIGGGLWPGTSPYPVLLARPGLLFILLFVFAVSVWLLRIRKIRTALAKRRFPLGLALVGSATLIRAATGGPESGIEGILLIAVSILVASPLRAMIRLTQKTRARALRVEAALLVCACAGSGLFWWNPSDSNPDFEAARDRGHALRAPLEWIARNVPVDEVVIAAPGYSAPVAALAGRRVLFEPSATSGLDRLFEQPGRREYLLVTALEGFPKERLAKAFSARFLLAGPGELRLKQAPPENASDDPVLTLEPVYVDANDFHVFRLVKK